MARYIGPKCKLARREGTDLFLKSARRSLDSKCKLDTKPGQHGVKSGARTSDYGHQLREKQKLRRIYGVLERQFRRYFLEATQAQGLDRHEPAAAARVAARQRRLPDGPRLDARRSAPARVALLDHRQRQGAERSVGAAAAPATSSATTDKAKGQLRIQDALQLAEKVGFPSWVEVDPKKMTGTFKGAPDRSEFGQDINESLVVELYSK